MKQLLLTLLFIAPGYINAGHTNKNKLPIASWHNIKIHEQIAKMITNDRADELALWFSTAKQAAKKNNYKIKKYNKKHKKDPRPYNFIINEVGKKSLLTIAIIHNAYESIKVLNKTQTDC